MINPSDIRFIGICIIWSMMMTAGMSQDKYYFESPFLRLPMDSLYALEESCSDPDSLLPIKYSIARKLDVASNRVLDSYREFMDYSLAQQDSLSYHLGAMSSSIPLINSARFDSAQVLLDRSLQYFKVHDERLWIRNQILLAFLNTAQLNYKEAFKYLKRAEIACDQDRYPKEYNDILNRLGLLYDKVGEEETAVEYYQQVIQNCKEHGHCNLYRAALSNTLVYYEKVKDSLNYFKVTDELIRIRRRRKRDIDKKRVLQYRIGQYMFQNDLESIAPLIDSVLIYSYRWGHISQTCYDHDEAADYYQKTGNTEKQIEHLQGMLDLASEHNLHNHVHSASEKLAIVYADLGQNNKAARLFNRAIDARNKNNKEEKVKEFKSLEQNLFVRNYKLELQNVEQNAALLKAKNELQKLRLLWLSILGVLLLLITIYLFWNSRQKSKMQQKVEAQNQEIENNLKEKELLLKEVHHRVKNNMQIVSGILSIQAETLENEEAKSAFIDGKSRINSMAMIHQNLYQTGTLASVDTKQYITRLVNRLLETYSSALKGSEINVEFDVEKHDIPMEEMVSLGLIINELVTNSLKYGFIDRKEGNLEITFRRSEGHTELIIADDGIGMDEASTDSMHSFGWRMVQSFASKMDAELQVNTQHGTHISLNYKSPKA